MSAEKLLAIAVSQYIAEHGSVADAVARILGDIGGFVDSAAIRHAGRVISEDSGGRPSIDDDAAIDEIRRRLSSGASKSLYAAADTVSRKMAKTENTKPASIRRRLFRKMKVKN